ncbi:MAG: methyltransferase domain-containing protein [Bryobacterales bacterium]|nr:methyltransferase domain-containing protein [Bryobacterales bacterium]
MPTTDAIDATHSHSIDVHEISADKMPGHWLLASLGKRVLRPGGLALTSRLLGALNIGKRDDVLELAPGLGVTARMTLSRHPHSYTAVERDEKAARGILRILEGTHNRCVLGTAENTGLPSEAFTTAYGEAMLTIQGAPAKARILEEVRRVLKPGGKYGIHELCIVPDESGEAIRREIEKRLSTGIHVGVQPLVAKEWRQLLESAGFRVLWEERAPMHLLEPKRLIRDEGFFGALRFAFNLLRRPDARKRVVQMRNLFREYRQNLEAIAFVCEKV